jgi:SAM-dependent methyltransferase
MNGIGQTASDQTTLWNGVAGCAWVELQGSLDRIFQPFEDLLSEAVSLKRGGPVLDVGCGTGSTTVAVARLLEAKARCIGIDISEPMLTAARARAERERIPASFICANAQTHEFETASFDLIISRFGVMFFDDPIRAFANLRRAATDGADLRFIAWRNAAENPFMTTAERAAAYSQRPTNGLVLKSSKRFAPPLILTSTAQKFALPPSAGWLAHERELKQHEYPHICVQRV